MVRPKIAPFFIDLLKEYTEPYVYYDFGRRKVGEGRPMGYYFCKLSGLREFDPVTIFTKDNMKRFHTRKELFEFLNKVDYERFRFAKHDPNFIKDNHEWIKKLYYPREAWMNIINTLKRVREDLKKKYDKVLVDFHKEDEDALNDFKEFIDEWGGPLN